MTADFITGGEIQDIPSRALKADICRKYGYRVMDDAGGKSHVADFRNRTGQLVGQKVRGKAKSFRVVGKVSEVLFGCHLFRDGGKRLVITEGEIDALSGAQALGDWPVVSIPNGAAGAKKAIAANIEWVNTFDEVVIAFDNDEVGQKAAQECALILAPGKAKLATLRPPYKDFNDALKAGDNDAIRKAVWEARQFRPDGVLGADDIWDKLNSQQAVETCLYPWAGLNQLTRGLRKRELVTITAGSGIGKSALCREIAYDLVVNQGRKAGCLFLEENVTRTALGFMGLHANQPLHLEAQVVPKDYEEAFEATLGSGRLYLFDHFGSLDLDQLMSRVRYMAVGLGCDYIFLDHISIVLSGLSGNDERKDIDMIMTRLRTLVEETGVGLILVSHLKRPESGTSHETGLVPQLSHLRGSHAIAQLSDMVLAAARNQQADSLEDRNTVDIYVLKNRFSGETGHACEITYNPSTGRLLEAVEDLSL